jgi:hypothetical protein
MKLKGRDFDGSSSLFKTHQHVQPALGSAVWLTEFNPIKNENLHFVEQLLHTLCALGRCCTIAGTFSTYTAGILGSYYVIALHIAQTSSAVSLFSKSHSFMLGNFKFEYQAAENYNISRKYIDSIPNCFHRYVKGMWTMFQYKFCRSYLELSNITIQKYVIVAVPFETPEVLYLRHYRATSDAWKTNLLCDYCFESYTKILEPIIANCTLQISCTYNVCLRQPPSLRSLASHAVFLVRCNID